MNHYMYLIGRPSLLGTDHLTYVHGVGEKRRIVATHVPPLNKIMIIIK